MEELSIKVSEEVKNKILAQISNKKEYSNKILKTESARLESFQASLDMSVSELFNENFERGVRILQEESTLSPEFSHLLCRFFDCSDIELNLDEDTKLYIFHDLQSRSADEEKIAIFKKWIFNDGFSMYSLSRMYSAHNILEDARIPIEPDVASILLLESKTNDYWEEIEQELSQFSSLKYATYKFFGDKEKQSECHYKLMTFYNIGLITEEQMLKYLGKLEFNPGLEENKVNHLKIMRNRLEQVVKEILDYKDVDFEAKGVSKKTIENLSEFFSRVCSLEDISTLDNETLENIYKRFNEISNEEWRDYLNKNPNSFLMHSTLHPVKGKFHDSVISTSLITQEFNDTYRGPVGYIIKPKHIQRANHRDVYVYNSYKNVYAQSADLIVKLPQIVYEGVMIQFPI